MRHSWMNLMGEIRHSDYELAAGKSLLKILTSLYPCRRNIVVNFLKIISISTYCQEVHLLLLVFYSIKIT